MVYLQLQATGSGFVSVTYTAFLLQESKPTLFSGYSQTSATFDSHLAFVFFLTHIFAFQLCPSPRLKWNLFISLVVSKKGSHISGIFESNLSKNLDIQYDNFWISARWPSPTGTYCGPPQSQTSDVWLTVDLESVSWGLGRPFMHTSKILLNLILSESPNKIYIDVMSDNTVLTFLYFFLSNSISPLRANSHQIRLTFSPKKEKMIIRKDKFWHCSVIYGLVMGFKNMSTSSMKPCL